MTSTDQTRRGSTSLAPQCLILFLLLTFNPRNPFLKMTSVGAVTKQIAALEISSKPNTTRPTGTTHQKKPSQNGQNVTKLLSKFAAPPPPAGVQKPTTTSSIPAKPSTRSASPTKATAKAVPAPAPSAQYTIDIGRYDGGFEIDNENRGERVYGEAAEQLALDSSVSRFVAALCPSQAVTLICCPRPAGTARHANGA